MATSKKLKIGVGVGVSVTSIVGLLYLLTSLYNFQITGTDDNCLGTLLDPCISYVSVYNPNKFNVDIYNDKNIALKFNPEIPKYYLFYEDKKCDGKLNSCCSNDNVCMKGWHYLDFTKKTKQNVKKSYVFTFPANKTTKFLLWGLKNNPDEKIKWSFIANKVELDPMWTEITEEPTLIYSTDFAVKFNEQIVTNETDYSKIIDYGIDYVSVDSNTYSEFDKPATITFSNLQLENPIVLKDEIYDTSIIPYASGKNVWSIDVLGFTKYQIIDSNWTNNGTLTNLSIINQNLSKSQNAFSAYYFEDNQTITDSSLTVNHQTLTGWSLNMPDDGYSAYQTQGRAHVIYFNNTARHYVNTSVTNLGKSWSVTWWYKQGYDGKCHNMAATFPYFWSKNVAGQRAWISKANGCVITLQLNDTTTTLSVVGTATTNVSDNVWHSAVAVYNHSIGRLILYHNGIHDKNGSSTTPWNFTDFITVGAIAGTVTSNLDGYIDDFKIFNYSLSETEIANLYANESAGKYQGYTTNPINDLRFNKSTGTTVWDDSGNTNASAFNYDVTRPAYIGSGGSNNSEAFNFSGYQSIIIPNETLYDFTGNITVAAWIKTGTSANGNIIMKDSGAGGTGWVLKAMTANRIAFNLQGTGFKGCIAGFVYSDNVPHQIVATANNSGCFIWIDGTLNNWSNGNGNINANNFNISIGGYPASNINFTGLIDNVIVFDRTVTTAEVVNYNATDQKLIYINGGEWNSSYFNSTLETNYNYSQKWCNITLNKSASKTLVYGKTENSTAYVLSTMSSNVFSWNPCLEGLNFNVLFKQNGNYNETDLISSYDIGSESNTCYCPNQKNWFVNLSDNCMMNYACNMTNNIVYLNQTKNLTGNITFNNTFYFGNMTINSTNATIYIKPTAKFYIG